MTLRLGELAALVRERRGTLGVRAAAAAAGVSPATFSRVENGQMPDLETFAKICKWLDVDPSDFLGTARKPSGISMAVVHFKKSQATKTETATSLANLIMSAQEALRARASLLE